MTTSDLLILAAPWATLGLGMWAGIQLERHRRDQQLEDLLDRREDA